MTTPYYTDDNVTVYAGDCLDVLKTLPDNSIDAVCCDPPYAISFMQKTWDHHASPIEYQLWCQQWATECLRVLKPGGHLLAFGGTRTAHRLASAIEDAGFEIRDSIAWLYGSGFPKSLDVSKAIDKQRTDDPQWRRVGHWIKTARQSAGMSTAQVCAAIGAHGETNHGGAMSNWENGFCCPTWDQWLSLRQLLQFSNDMDVEVWRLNGRKGTPGEAWQTAEVVGIKPNAMAGWSMDGTTQFVDREVRTANSDAARTWQGWGTALKPAFEPIIVARKPLAASTVAGNVLAHGTGGLNIDATRVQYQSDADRAFTEAHNRHADWGSGARDNRVYGADNRTRADAGNYNAAAGRWPPNVTLDPAAAAELDKQSAGIRAAKASSSGSDQGGGIWGHGGKRETQTYLDSGGASRFFPTFKYTPKAPTTERPTADGIQHPTCKPLELMRWLVKLVVPPHGTVLDPFAGTGTTGEAAILEHMRCILIEREPTYLPLIKARLHKPIHVPMDFHLDGDYTADTMFTRGGTAAYEPLPQPQPQPDDELELF